VQRYHRHLTELALSLSGCGGLTAVHGLGPAISGLKKLEMPEKMNGEAE